jgi:hypothetical protein
MNRSIQSKILIAVAATAALAATSAASASTQVYLSIGVPAFAAAPTRVAHPVYEAAPRSGGQWRDDQERAWRRACRAAPWEPDARYLPGDTVRRHGTVYVASRLSASVWNVNSPPEWTPNYWVATDCTPQRRHAEQGQPGRWR